MTFIARLFTRFLALILALSVLGGALWLAIYMHPESAGGWVLRLAVPLMGALGAFLVYRGLMRATGFGAPHAERTGAGLLMGLGYRSRQDEGDQLDL
ncbi:MAG: hypothetical protein GC187_13270 [Alphaproteobacteria bacterium]|nr:hypothetical protein [Alphaproteobacteria bacterium]